MYIYTHTNVEQLKSHSIRSNFLKILQCSSPNSIVLIVQSITYIT